MFDQKHDWLEVHRERLEEAHTRAKEYAEQKAAERIELDKDKVYCPPVHVGQLVYLRHRPQGRNKIQDSWSPTVHRVVEVQGTTVEPVEGGPVKRVHRADLRPCVGPVPAPRRGRASAAPETAVHVPPESVPVDTDPEYVVPEEAPCLSLGPGVNREIDEVADSQGQRDTKSEYDPGTVEVEPSDSEPEVETPVPVTDRDARGNVPVPAPRRTLRANAGVHLNPNNVPMSACNAISLSPYVLSQLLTSMGAVFFREAVKEVKAVS